MSSVSTRLVRLLNMVPYFQANPGISAEEAAADLGVSTKQLMTDLNQLWMCGAAHMPSWSLRDGSHCSAMTIFVAVLHWSRGRTRNRKGWIFSLLQFSRPRRLSRNIELGK